MIGQFFTKIFSLRKTAKLLKNGQIGILPTDTVYGLVGSALQSEVVEKIYQLRKRDLKKPLIILISSWKDLNLFDIKLSFQQKKILKKTWPGQVSVVLDCDLEKFAYLHRGNKTLAFRVPKVFWLRWLLRKSGPLVAPSANRQGESVATSIFVARKYFGDQADFYVEGGYLNSLPSTIIKLEKSGEWETVRPGIGKV